MAKVDTEPPISANDDDNDDDEEPELWDTIVIGSGIGGLSCASLLAQIKKQKVLVVDQHPENAGGACHGFEEKGYPFAAGIHYIGEMGENDALKSYLDALTLPGDEIEWTRFPDNYESVMLGGGDDAGDDSQHTITRYDWIANDQEQALKNQFPDDTRAIEGFFKELKKAAAAFERGMIFKVLPRTLTSFLIKTGLIRLFDKGYTKYAKITLRDVTSSLTDNPNLRTVMEYIYGDYGVAPTEAPFLLHACAILHYAKGAYYPTGGPEEIPKRIARAIEKIGGQVRINSRVRTVWVEEGRAVGVKLCNGIRARAPLVISDAGMYNTLRHLVPQEFCPSHIRGSTPLDSKSSCFCLFVGLEGDTEFDFGIAPTILRSNDTDERPIAERVPNTIQGMLDMPPQSLEVFVSCPTACDKTAKDRYPNKTSLQIFCDAPYEAFADWDDQKTHKAVFDHKQDYESFKAAFAEKMWKRARGILVATGASDSKLPKCLADAAVAEMGTPLTMERYLATEKGAVYALDHNASRFDPKTFFLQLRPDSTTLPGLYFSGQDVATCGLVGAMMGGYICAGKILGDPNPESLCKKVKADRT